tara:strand:- start:4727 stop:4972 length:246 start_codon:yes stop_codon:yes gene_type:complete
MGEPNALPNRTKIGSKVFSPWVDRVSLVALALVGYFAAPEISSVLEEWLGGWSIVVTGCGLLVLVPLIATWIGKLNVRIRA